MRKSISNSKFAKGSNGEWCYIDKMGREWYKDNLDDLLAFIESFKECMDTANYYF